MDNTNSHPFVDVKLPENCTLRRKETFEYTTEANTYDVELFHNQDNTFYAIGIPREGTRLLVYGSSEVKSAQMALQILIDKIRREAQYLEAPFGEPTIDADETFEMDDE